MVAVPCAMMNPSGRGYTVTDLGSTNGTKVNGRDVQSAPLADGDRITVGATQIEYRSA